MFCNALYLSFNKWLTTSHPFVLIICHKSGELHIDTMQVSYFYESEVFYAHRKVL